MHYAWGSKTALSNLLGREPSGRPEAELWMGAHPKGPARLLEVHGAGAECSTLEELIARDPPSALGESVATRFGRLPFLLKILAIDSPLSLQVHPDAEQAREGFRREEVAGVARDSTHRNYKDESHKPELLLALSEVEAVSGFVAPQHALAVLRALGLHEGTGALPRAVAAFARNPSQEGLERLFRGFFELSRDAIHDAVRRAVRASPLSAQEAWSAPLRHWLEVLSRHYPSDPGVLAFLLLRHVRLQPGEALFLPPRQLHAYLSGVGVEVMASSDNVLRGGLTPKHVDVDELCRVLDFSSCPPELVPFSSSQEATGVRIRRWQPPVDEFSLIEIELAGGAVQLPAPSVMVVMSGELEFEEAGRRSSLRQAAQAFHSPGSRVRVCGHGRFFCATVPSLSGP